MVYVIAAYTIALCTLALYAVLLEHRGRVFAANQDSLTAESAISLPRGFNVGAALLAPLWMWGHGLRLPGGALFVISTALFPLYDREMWIPLLLLTMVLIAVGTALGFVGHRIAVGHRGAESIAEFYSSQLPWATVGVASYGFVLPWVWFFLSADAFPIH